MPYKDLKKIDDKLHAGYDERLGDHESIFSTNTKTKWSIDFPIARTCQGRTPICSAVCYGARKGAPQAANLEVLEKQLRVLRFFEETDSDVVTHRIMSEHESKRMECLRWCAVGDLTFEAVRVINRLGREYPLVRQWIVTRIPWLAAQISRDAPNLRVMFSLDGSAESALALAEIAQHQHPLVRYSFLRLDPDEPTMGADVVFDLRKGLAPPPPPAFICPADSGRFDHKKNACTRCGWRCAR
jgi:hypothetical protein